MCLEVLADFSRLSTKPHPLRGVVGRGLERSDRTWCQVQATGHRGKLCRSHLEISCGGWESLKHMLDIYRGVIDGLEEIDYEGINGWLEEAAAAALDVDPSGGVESLAAAGAQVISLEEYRLRRQRGK